MRKIRYKKCLFLSPRVKKLVRHVSYSDNTTILKRCVSHQATQELNYASHDGSTLKSCLE